MNSIPLNFMCPGQTAWIDQILGDADQVRRLEELGVQCGTCIEMVRPGEACIVRHADRRLCFRGADAIRIMVRPAALAAAAAEPGGTAQAAHLEEAVA